eukprot:6666758-Alexandrium_andersonii.AAC.1
MQTPPNSSGGSLRAPSTLTHREIAQRTPSDTPPRMPGPHKGPPLTSSCPTPLPPALRSMSYEVKA